MQVWRWEHRDRGTGPYQQSDDIELFDALGQHELRSDRPGPWRDDLVGPMMQGWRFGSPSRESLDDWFSDIPLELLVRDGYVVREYDVPDAFASIGASGRQVAYDPFAAELVKEFEIDPAEFASA